MGAGSTPVAILAIPGSLRESSLNVRLLAAAARLAAPDAALEQFVQSTLERIPPFRPEADPVPDAVGELRAAISSADGLLIATPEYNASIPGSLKNAIDWASDPREGGSLRGKPVAVVGVDRGEFGGDWGQADTRKVLEAAGARVVSTGLAVTEEQANFSEDGDLRDEDHARRLRLVLEELIEEARPL
jgi:chromate reductase, NAD(P)H dehydrogenase (quinone)